MKYTPLRVPVGRPKGSGKPPRSAFSTIEYAIIRMVIRGRPNKEIAFELAIGKRYLIALFIGIYKKVGLSRRECVPRLKLLYWTLSDPQFEKEWIAVGVNPSASLGTPEIPGIPDAPRPY